MLKIDAIDFFELGILDDDAGTEKRTQIRVAGMGPAGFEQLLLQGQCTIEDKTTRTGETTHLMPLLSVRPQFKPISLAESIVPDRLESGAHASYANLRAGRLEAGRRVPAFKVSVALAFRVLESAPRAVPPQCP